MPIQILPPEVAAKIAAGEVVERPASVVKELVENALDAGARHIRIEVREGGRRLIRISDDGSGIARAELPLAFARHATSKLRALEDLERIRTLGFRGEALASIAAVSRVTMMSRPADSPSGVMLQLEGGVQTRQSEVGMAPGTVVTVENLFYNVPARLKFLKAPATEAGHIHRVVTRYAMAFPEVRFHLKLDGRDVLQTSGDGSLYNVLLELFGPETCRQLLALPEQDIKEDGASTQVGVSGYVGAPTLHHAQREHITLFVNRRWVQDRMLAAAIAQAYHTLLPAGRYPMAVINVTLDPSEVDVNVHPTKNEVKFRDPHTVFRMVQQAVRQALLEKDSIAAITLRSEERMPARTSSPAETGWHQLAHFGFEVQRTLDDTDGGQTASQTRLPVLRVLGQLALTYVIAEGPDGLYLIDQHAAHERVLFEEMKRHCAAAAVPSQQLLPPLLLELTPGQAAVLEAERATLSQLGFEIEPFGGYTYRLCAVPEMLAWGDPAMALRDILSELAEGGIPPTRRADERVITIVCKRAAIKAGQALSLHEMQELVRRLEQCQAPRTCPHGRPTMLYLSAAQLAREFGRI
ncbi:MAG: DNA mismatch repair endonuclease MutL [Anaerolineae bacterium]|nr:DNA mismatch repair endonuclease MutL [Anaerolineae bacterium]MDW8071617.1 DNA mismatch repair endonuclease MutL [Anaerolineae bacterium]